jgi:hypothetical protein
VQDEIVCYQRVTAVRAKLSALPMEQHVRELLLAQSQPGLHRVYDLHAYEEEKRHGLELWHAKLRAFVEPKGVVVPFAASA